MKLVYKRSCFLFVLVAILLSCYSKNNHSKNISNLAIADTSLNSQRLTKYTLLIGRWQEEEDSNSFIVIDSFHIRFIYKTTGSNLSYRFSLSDSCTQKMLPLKNYDASYIVLDTYAPTSCYRIWGVSKTALSLEYEFTHQMILLHRIN